jgi:hypothetical protein
MFSTVSFWTLFWAEVLTTFWASLGGPIDYTLPYPTRFSYDVYSYGNIPLLKPRCLVRTRNKIGTIGTHLNN